MRAVLFVAVALVETDRRQQALTSRLPVFNREAARLSLEPLTAK